VAAFLAPAVIINKDSVFRRFGLALPADRWTEEAARLLVAAGYDACTASELIAWCLTRCFMRSATRPGGTR